MAGTRTTWRIEVRGRGAEDFRARGLPEEARALGLGKLRRARNARLYLVSGTIAPEELELLGRFLFSDQVVEDFVYKRVGEGGREEPPGPSRAVVEILPRPGVTDAEAEEALRAAGLLGIGGVEAVSTGRRWELEGEGLDEAYLARLTRALLANPLVDRWSFGEIREQFFHGGGEGGAGPEVELLDLRSMDDGALLAVSRSRRAALDLEEMRAIREHFRGLDRPATDVEFEMIAQTWSEHCVHKTFKALVEVEGSGPGGSPTRVDSIFSEYIRRPTEEIGAPWVLSAFVDNAGVIEFDEELELSFKVETHNHPSAVEPFGGANTGLGGVIRDIMGVSARPVAATDVLCFGPAELPPESLPEGGIHPRLLAREVVAGIEDYGNKMGIPTVNGGLHYHEGYASNPLVYCGCVGIAPRGLRRSGPGIGDRVVVIGGLTGRDGIRGATFSSMAMDGATGELAGASVQIGNPITQKKALDVLLAARDAGLYSAVTDCGAGGLSSAVGELGAETGVDVELSAIGTKYPGLAPWELWLSEAQERMVLAVPPEKLGALKALCVRYGAGFFDLGFFSGEGLIVARMEGRPVLELSAAFLHKGLPRKTLRAAPGPRRAPPAPAPTEPEPAAVLLALLGTPGSSSPEEVLRRYDHEVQGGTLLAPLDGPRGEAPQDGAVIVPQGSSGRRAFALANGFRPAYAVLDPHAAAVSAHDECLRNLVAVGADPERVAVLDNFCMGDPGRPEVLWDLLESARGLRDSVLEHRTPIISGKDSFYNEYEDGKGGRRAVPPSLLVSGVGLVPRPDRVPGSWLKEAGGILYLLGDFRPRFGGSAYAARFGLPRGGDPAVPGRPEGARALYAALHREILAGRVASAHDLSEGGLGPCLAEMALGAGLGARISLDSLAAGRTPAALLFGESNGCFLVEAGAGEGAAFETSLAGLPCRRIGQVEKEPILIIEGEGGFRLGLGELLGAWKGPGRGQA